MKSTKTQIKSYRLTDVSKDSETPMSGGERMEMMKRVIESDLRLEPLDYSVYFFLFRHSNLRQLTLIDYTGKSYKQGTGYYVGVSMEIILQALPTQKVSIVKALKNLESAGLITIPFKAGGRTKLGSCYRIITDLPNKDKWLKSDDLPKLKGTAKMKGQGVKDRWKWFNNLYGVMGKDGVLKQKKILSTSAYILFLLFAQSEWKQTEFNAKTKLGWYAVINKKQIRERLGIKTRKGLERHISNLEEMGMILDFGTGFFKRAGKDVGVILLRFDDEN